GTVHLYYGTATGLEREPAWTRYGDNADDRAGVAVAAGDIDGDGLADIAIGEPGVDIGAFSNAGRIAVALGTFETPREDRRFLVSGLAASHGLGAHLAGIGDFDGDGLGDLVACELLPAQVAPVARFLAGGRNALREFGIPLWLQRCTPEPTLAPSMASAGDFDNDGLADAAYIYREPNFPVLGVIGASIGASYQHNAKRWGRALGTYGDVDGNGIDDLFLATPSDAAGRGQLHSFRAPWGTPLEAISADEIGDGLGEAAAGIGDLDGDGFADYLVGAPSRNVDGANAGSAWIYRGGPTGISEPSAYLVAVGVPGERVGRQVGAAGDLNGDGFPDFMVARVVREGRWRIDLYFGNGALGAPAANGLSTHVRSPRTGRPVAYGGLLDTAQSLTVRTLGVTAFGAMPVVLEAEARRFDRMTSPGAMSRSPTRSATQARTGISTVIEGLEAQTPYHIRARLRAPLARAPVQVATRWVSPFMPQKPSKLHVRTRLNANPVALSEEYTTLQGVGFQTATGASGIDSVLANDFDPDNDPLTATMVDAPNHGDLTLLPTGHFFYRPKTEFWGTDTFTYRAADGLGGQAEATAAIHVHPIAPCEAASESRCREGDYFLVVETTQGLASVHCWVERAPDRVACDIDESGALRLGPPTCEGPIRSQ
ncbi:MAG: FG-GAP repeat protein, partial [Deltaproteobacteria bacterium]|nr:FG-GAP repeat protein [Deltaproteobacteria bacterium]